MSGRITIDNLSDSLKEMISNSGSGLSEEQVLNLINENGLSEEQVISLVKDNLTGDLTQLSTTNKTNIVAAINELFQSANNGKELIANAIGEPLSSNDTFSAMSTDINGLLSTFKTNMMNNGVTVSGSDKFKSLIDKIATLADNEGKGVQFVQGTSTVVQNLITYTRVTGATNGYYYIEIPNLTFEPLFIIAKKNAGAAICFINASLGFYYSWYNTSGKHITLHTYSDGSGVSIAHGTSGDTSIDFTNIKLPVDISTTGTWDWYAIGVGEEDTTLRDSLADILEDKGVDVTEEDDMASLISKVEQKLDESSNYLLKNGGDPSIYTINYDYVSGNATATHKTNYLQFSTSGSNYQSAFAFFTLKEEIDLTDKTMIMFDLEIKGTTKYTYFAYGVYKGTLDNDTTFVKGNNQNNKIDYESSLYEKRAKYIIDVSDCTGVHKIGLRIGAYGVYSSTLNLYNIEIV